MNQKELDNLQKQLFTSRKELSTESLKTIQKEIDSVPNPSKQLTKLMLRKRK